MTGLEFLLIGLATHRLTSIWIGERIAAPLREWTFKTFLQPLTSCPFCVSVWIAAGLWVGVRYGGTAGIAAAATFAASEVSVFLEFVLRRLIR